MNGAVLPSIGKRLQWRSPTSSVVEVPRATTTRESAFRGRLDELPIGGFRLDASVLVRSDPPLGQDRPLEDLSSGLLAAWLPSSNDARERMPTNSEDREAFVLVAGEGFEPSTFGL